MKETLDLLIVDDDDSDATLVAHRFRAAGYTVRARRVDLAGDMAAALKEGFGDIVIADVKLPRFSAADALKLYGEFGRDCPFLVVSGAVSEEMAVSLLKAGAHDFISKNNLARLVPAAERELREAAGRRARRRAEEALRISEERYALAARGANDGLWDWDLKTNRIYFSPRWAEMMGRRSVRREPAVWFDAIHPDDRALVSLALDDHLSGNSPHFAAEYRLCHADGGWRWMLARGMAVTDDDGVPCRIAGSQTDITAHKEAEQRLQRAKEALEEAVSAKSRFLAAASHDLRQPLQAMFCFAALLESRVTDSGRTVVDDLTASLAGMKDLLDSLLDVSRLDAGVVKAEQSCFPASALLRQIEMEMRPAAEAKGLDFRVVPSEVCLCSDPVLLARIVRNLVDNAIRYTDRGGILLGCRRRGDHQAITVYDTGLGIDRAAQDKIFEEFYQVANPERDRRKGLGLGLAIVNRLSRLLDHPISLRSAPGKGSSFAVGVPAIPRGVTQAAEPASHADAPPAHRTVLVIEDEAMVGAALAELLRVWGFQTTVASSLDEANALVSEAPAIVVADYRLRERATGIQAVNALRERFATTIPCIVVTGDTAADRIREITDSGAVLLHKPVAPTDLKKALKSVLS